MNEYDIYSGRELTLIQLLIQRDIHLEQYGEDQETGRLDYLTQEIIRIYLGFPLPLLQR